MNAKLVESIKKIAKELYAKDILDSPLITFENSKTGNIEVHKLSYSNDEQKLAAKESVKRIMEKNKIFSYFFIAQMTSRALKPGKTEFEVFDTIQINIYECKKGLLKDKIDFTVIYFPVGKDKNNAFFGEEKVIKNPKTYHDFWNLFV